MPPQSVAELLSSGVDVTLLEITAADGSDVTLAIPDRGDAGPDGWRIFGVPAFVFAADGSLKDWTRDQIDDGRFGDLYMWGRLAVRRHGSPSSP